MAFKKRRMMFIPEVNPKSFIFFFERARAGQVGPSETTPFGTG